jgi:hypothetical protein
VWESTLGPFVCRSSAEGVLCRCRCSTTLDDGFRGRLLVGEGQIQIDDLRDFPLLNDEAHNAALTVRLAFPRFPPGAAIAGTMLLRLRIVAPRRFSFCRPYSQRLTDRLYSLIFH